jgi:hypothetical protein
MVGRGRRGRIYRGVAWWGCGRISASRWPKRLAPPVRSAAVSVVLVGGTVAGRFDRTPLGVVLHGSRSGVEGRSSAAEFNGTVDFAGRGANGLGWNATVGDAQLALHMGLHEFGWNARGCSQLYLAVEIAQATAAGRISDPQVESIAHFVHLATKVWPDLPLNFPTHAELDGSRAYGTFDGKTDVFPRGDDRADELRARILAAL